MHPLSKLPDPEICKTRSIANNVWECLVAHPALCRFLSRFGNGYYCNHHDRRNFESKESPDKEACHERKEDCPLE
jgi:hypothetical protein